MKSQESRSVPASAQPTPKQPQTAQPASSQAIANPTPTSSAARRTLTWDDLAQFPDRTFEVKAAYLGDKKILG